MYQNGPSSEDKEENRGSKIKVFAIYSFVLDFLYSSGDCFSILCLLESPNAVLKLDSRALTLFCGSA